MKNNVQSLLYPSDIWWSNIGPFEANLYPKMVDVGKVAESLSAMMDQYEPDDTAIWLTLDKATQQKIYS